MNQAGRLPLKYEKAGSWVGKNGTIDIVAKDRTGRILAGICEFLNDVMTKDDYERLLKTMKQARIKAEYIYLFSAGGFDSVLEELAKERADLKLICLSQL